MQELQNGNSSLANGAARDGMVGLAHKDAGANLFSATGTTNEETIFPRWKFWHGNKNSLEGGRMMLKLAAVPNVG